MIYSADGVAVIDAHLTDGNAHKDEFAKYLPLSGGKMTGAITGGDSDGLIIKTFDNTIDDVREWRGFSPLNGSPTLFARRTNGQASMLQVNPQEQILQVHDGNHTSGIRISPLKVEITDIVPPTTDTMPTPKSYVDNAVKTAQPVAHLVTLAASSWNSSAKTQTVSVADVVADETAQQILPMPAAASMSAYNDAGILCTGQGAGTLTFTADTAPTTDLQVYVTITPVQFS